MSKRSNGEGTIYHRANGSWQAQHLIPKKLDDALFYDFLAAHPEWSDSTRHSAACAAKALYRYLYGAFHPLLKVKVHRGDPGPQRTLTEAQANQLLASLDTTTGEGVRNLAIITLAIDTGLRNAELCRLELEHLNLDTRRLQVMVKGRKWGEGIYSEYTTSCLQSWLSIRPLYALKDTTTVFVGIKGTTPGRPLTTGGLRSLFRCLGSRSGLGLISRHDLRRTMATLATANGAPTRTVQKAGRWSRIDMVERYTQQLDIQAFAQYFPVAKLMATSEADQPAKAHQGKEL